MDWSRFDKRVLLTCDRYGDRRPGALAELARVGLDADELTNPYVPTWGLFSAHESAYRAFLSSGKRRLLVIEDDVRFLKDLERLQRLVNSLPDDADEARLCWGGARGDAARAKGGWARVESNRGTLYMTACYSLTRRAAEESLALFDDVREGRREFRNIDLQAPWRAPAHHIYVCSPPAAIVSAAPGVSGASARSALLLDAAACGVSADAFAG